MYHRRILICGFGDRRKKKKIIHPICSVVAVFKMLVRILNTLRSRIWDMVFFLFSDYSKSTVGKNGDSPEGSMFLPNCTRFSKGKRIVISLILFRCAKRFILPQKTKTSEKRVRSFQSQNSTAQSHKMQYL